VGGGRTTRDNGEEEDLAMTKIRVPEPVYRECPKGEGTNRKERVVSRKKEGSGSKKKVPSHLGHIECKKKNVAHLGGKRREGCSIGE